MKTLQTVPSTKTRTKRGSTRRNMLISAAEVMRERGAAGVTIDEVLARSGAPRGSVYYHFPEGRNQILAEALRWAGDTIADSIDAAAERGALPLVRGFIEFWERDAAGERLRRGLPVVAAAIGCASDEAELATIASDIFGRWRDALTRAFVADDFDAADAESLAVTCIASLEGAVVLCRSIRNAEPLRQVASPDGIPHQVKGIRSP